MSATATVTTTSTTASRPRSRLQQRQQQHQQRQEAKPISSLPHPLPKYHLKAPRGWINDPCAPGYDVSTGTYHLYYQWNPKSCIWGDITWGQFTSRDGIHWSAGADPDNNKSAAPSNPPEEPVLICDKPYDKDGIFTGCLHPTGPNGETGAGRLTVFYTSACHLPIHWTLPHTRDSEGLAMATSADGGRTWAKFPGNPILKGEPEDVEVTGFRDPFLAEWPAMDEIRGVGVTGRGEKGALLYGALSGGIRGKGPTVFLYSVEPENLAEWTYLGPLVVDMPPRFSASPCSSSSSSSAIPLTTSWSGNFGVNWECANFMTLESPLVPQPDDAAAESVPPTRRSRRREFLIVGAEGSPKPGIRPGDASDDPAKHGETNWSYPLWMAGTLHNDDDDDDTNTTDDDNENATTSAATTAGTVTMRHAYSGFLDHGCLYAASSYLHPTTRQRILWGWLKEQDELLSTSQREAKGWTGYLSLPRELFLQVVEDVVGVVGGRAEKVEDVTSVCCVVDTGESGGKEAGDDVSKVKMTVETLGIRPLPGFVEAYHGQGQGQGQGECDIWRHVPAGSNTTLVTPLTSPDPSSSSSSSMSWALEATINIPLTPSGPLPTNHRQQQPRRVGFHIRHDADMTRRSTVYFAPRDGRIVVERRHSNTCDDAEAINKADVGGPFALFVIAGSSGAETLSSSSSSSKAPSERRQEKEIVSGGGEREREVGGKEQQHKVEPLRLRIFSDGDVLEVFANDRFALSTMVYSEVGCTGISTFVEYDDDEKKEEEEEESSGSASRPFLFQTIKLWQGLGDERGIHDV